MTSSWTAISMWNASSFLLGPFRDQYKCWFLKDLNSLIFSTFTIASKFLLLLFGIDPTTRTFLDESQNPLLGSLIIRGVCGLKNACFGEFHWINFSNCWKEGHTYFSCRSKEQNQSTQNIKECTDNIFSICVHLVTTNYIVHFIIYIYVHCSVYSTIVHSTLQYLVRSIGGYVNEAWMLRRGW